MCGIVGYVGFRRASDLIVEGLRRLEYRGYDSSGLAVLDHESQIHVRKAAGRLANLEEIVHDNLPDASMGIGHTRWATHGAPTDGNAHPHLGGCVDGATLAVVHNGVVENFRELKARLEAEGYVFQSETDSEVIAHLIDSCLARALETGPRVADEIADTPWVVAVREAIQQLRGTYGLLVLFRGQSDLLVAARLGSPLVIGVGDGEHFIASDSSPLAGHADRIVYLADHELAVITHDTLRVIHRDSGRIEPAVKPLEISAADVGLGGYSHYMLKEIHEQPETVRAAMRGRLSQDEATAVFGGLNLTPRQLQRVNRIVLTGCGTSWHAALVGEYLIEQFARLPVEVEYASELRYRNPPIDDGTLLFAITQSGETADTLAALREMKRKGHPTLAICNVVGSTIAQEADGGIYLHAGPEIGVASTKAFTSQCVVLALLALYFGRLRHMSYEDGLELIDGLNELPDLVSKALETDAAARVIAERYRQASTFLYLGRQYNFPVALEGALKLKEISYIHAEGYPAAEMKHGPIALVDPLTPSVFIIPQGKVYEKVILNLEEIKARKGPVIAVCSPGDERVRHLADEILEIPEVPDFLQPIVSAIPLQLLAYHIACLRGCDVDKPRNLAKSVTVE
ncbi:MAG: glutamine--fructose-6-phosphate transaminase (isomerizing) [Planctomycetota bacterium]|nr:glutamine--fructose-6-phosphate transaminase (isomerizing) [Planctomycetota bacterium]